jgi:multiple sugar transport system permease protein
MSQQAITSGTELHAQRMESPPTPRNEKGFIRLLFIPTLTFLITMAIFPLIYSIAVSLTDYTLGIEGARWIGFRNYAELFTSGDLLASSWVTLRFTVAAVTVEMVLGVLIAFALNERIPGAEVVRVIVFLPMMLAPIVVGLFWRFLFDQTFGMINWLLGLISIPPVAWLTDPKFAMAAMTIVDIWQWTPFVVLLTLASLGTIPGDLKEAATLDRASPWMRFRQIYWPYMRFPVLLALLFRTIDSLKMFDLAYVLTGGGPGDFTTTISLLAYRFSFLFFKIGKASAISWLIVIVISIIVNILLSVLMPGEKREKEEVVDTGL